MRSPSATACAPPVFAVPDIEPTLGRYAASRDSLGAPSQESVCEASIADVPHLGGAPPECLEDEEIGILLPNNQRQHRTLHIQKGVLPYALC